MKKISRASAARAPVRAAVLALGGLLLFGGSADAERSIRDEWLAAVDLYSSTWSRTAMLDAFLAGRKLATRGQAVDLLGPPNYSAELYSPGRGLTAHIDEYRLSAANDQTLRLDSDPDGRLIREPSIEAEGCACPACRIATNSLGSALGDPAVAKYLGSLASAPPEPRLLGAIESAFGAVGSRESGEGVFGQRTYVSVTVVWRIAGDAHRFVTVSGRTPLRDYRADSDMPVSDFAVVTVSDLCLAH